jgi:hypothetical protein
LPAIAVVQSKKSLPDPPLSRASALLRVPCFPRDSAASGWQGLILQNNLNISLRFHPAHIPSSYNTQLPRLIPQIICRFKLALA